MSARAPNRYPSGQPDPLPGMMPDQINNASLINDLCLDWNERQTEDFIGTIPVQYHPTLPKDHVVPPEGAWALDPGTRPGVTQYLKDVKKADGRKKDGTELRIIYEVPRDDWCGRVGKDQSVVLKDKHTGNIVGIVIRDFISVPSVVARMDEAAKFHVEIGRNARRDDTGTIAQYGYTGGPMSNRSFAWVRNLMKKHDPAVLRRHMHEIVSAHTLIFNIAAKKVPAPIIEGFRAASEGMPCMDWNMMGTPVTSRVSTNYCGSNHDLTGLELGPVQGLCTATYARRCHNEKAPPECPWVMSYTTSCNHDGLGGDFYYANLGIRVEQAANTLIIHNATEFHGTVVHDVNWAPHNRGPDAKEKKDPPVKWETDPPELLEHRGFSLLIPWDLRAIYQKGASQAQTAAYGAGPSSGNDLPPDATADAWDVDRMDIDE